ncbi:MAG: bifunctional 4-hydroxy-2-oxoglutarate aldolase/2-dehydro-3-deoxy-phosphogluconate aldolase [Cyanobacteria bacterium]|nr:bifunctional 4-hydroxy-2-oxoglutarate aldolase/2-dehydro-3-deoxy-phosphogluconate aldolase [Cyanobacteriota bacterium]MDW8199982.1 bifunctional 4-hydroxy-2-oxoglutarate aldolase/2-dehydro-3-deoxy-phosphogluconate aldolase [Cyanobacteriota bacterium SKYGB_h_bin112]
MGENPSRQQWLSTVHHRRAIAVIRTADMAIGRQLAIAAALGGIRLIEIAWNSDQPSRLIAELQQELPDCDIGAGTIVNREQLEAAIAAGAEFIFTPHVDQDLIRQAIAHHIPIIPGALSPTEIVQAWQAGASSVKVFPITAVGGVSYLRSLQAPLGHIPLIPTGGITLDNAKEMITAGAIAVGLSTALFPHHWVQNQNWSAIASHAARLVDTLEVIAAP